MKNVGSKSTGFKNHLLLIFFVSFVSSPGFLSKRFLVAVSYIEPWVQCLGYTLVSSRRSVSWGAARKMAQGKIGEKRDAGRRENGRLVAPHPSLTLLYFAPPF